MVGQNISWKLHTDRRKCCFTKMITWNMTITAWFSFRTSFCFRSSHFSFIILTLPTCSQTTPLFFTKEKRVNNVWYFWNVPKRNAKSKNKCGQAQKADAMQNVLLIQSSIMALATSCLKEQNCFCAKQNFIGRILTLRWLMSYIYEAPILDVSRSHTTTQHSR